MKTTKLKQVWSSRFMIINKDDNTHKNEAKKIKISDKHNISSME